MLKSQNFGRVSEPQQKRYAALYRDSVLIRFLPLILVACLSTNASRSHAQRPVIPDIPGIPAIPDIPEPLTPRIPKLPGFPGSTLRIPKPVIPKLPRLPSMEGGRLRISTSPFSRPTGRPASSPQQEPGAEPTLSGMMLPSGPISYGNGETLLVRGDDGTTSVARYHVGVGETRIVIMPDGRLEMFEEGKTQATQEPFRPIDLSAMETKMLADPRLKGFQDHSQSAIPLCLQHQRNFCQGHANDFGDDVPRDSQVLRPIVH